LFVCLLLNGTSALFRPLVPRIVEIEHTNHVKNDLYLTQWHIDLLLMYALLYFRSDACTDRSMKLVMLIV